MKKIFYLLCAAIITASYTSCSDMMETDSDRQVYDPELNDKTDSIFYTLGILKSVQEAIDQYVITNELRGDLLTTNSHTSTALKKMATFDYSNDSVGKYDSAYVYYKIINNCNYYVAHRDTQLYTGNRNVTMPEYAQAKSIRAWAYLQLVKTYGSVPYFTKPLTTIAEINSQTEKKTFNDICDSIINDLKPLSGKYGVPTYGTLNAGSSKSVISSKLMFPLEVVLGDVYLEKGDYEQAAEQYATYLVKNKITTGSLGVDRSLNPDKDDYTQELANGLYDTDKKWPEIFNLNNTTDLITLVPLATNSLRGTTTNLPVIFGYDYYAAGVSTAERYLPERQVDISEQYKQLSDNQTYYYATATNGIYNYKSAAVGDMRRWGITESATRNDTSFTIITKYKTADVRVYRYATVYLRFAEAINRMGYPAAAFAILKDGINEDLFESNYLSDEDIELFVNYGFFSYDGTNTTFDTNKGIHSRGCNWTADSTSLYTFNNEVTNKMIQTMEEMNIDITVDENAVINAVEDLICDEYALELAFEGTRFTDLCRIARHKNADTQLSSNFGGKWIANKLKAKNAVRDLSQETNWYIPFK